MMMIEQIRKSIVGALNGESKAIFTPTPIIFSQEVERFALDERKELLESIKALAVKYELDYNEVPKMLTTGLLEKLALEQGIEKVDNRLPL